MKRFIITVTLLFLTASLLLGTCMYWIWDSGKDRQESFEGFSRDLKDFSGDMLIGEEPTERELLKQKFSAMYEIDTEKNYITVISQKYLDYYWKSNPTKEKLRKLSISEILYIVQDSIDIFFKYDRVIMKAVGSGSLFKDYERIPFVSAGAVFKTKSFANNATNIAHIITYRILALTSPKAIISMDEIYEYRGEYYNGVGEYFYLIDYQVDTDREMHIKDFANGNFSGYSYLHLQSYMIDLHIDSKHDRIFPTVEMEDEYFVTLEAESGDFNISIDLISDTFTFENHESLTDSVTSGNVLIVGNELWLYSTLELLPNNEYVSYDYTFYFTDGRFKYYLDESTPHPDIMLNDGDLFSVSNEAFLKRFNGK